MGLTEAKCAAVQRHSCFLHSRKWGRTCCLDSRTCADVADETRGCKGGFELPHLLKRATLTAAKWSVRVASSLGVPRAPSWRGLRAGTRFQTFVLLSKPAVTKRVPSGWTCIEEMLQPAESRKAFWLSWSSLSICILQAQTPDLLDPHAQDMCAGDMTCITLLRAITYDLVGIMGQHPTCALEVYWQSYKSIQLQSFS